MRQFIYRTTPGFAALLTEITAPQSLGFIRIGDVTSESNVSTNTLVNHGLFRSHGADVPYIDVNRIGHYTGVKKILRATANASLYLIVYCSLHLGEEEYLYYSPQ
jgi:hypothetical protein